MEGSITISLKEWEEFNGRLIDVQEKVTKLLKDRENELMTPKEVCHKLNISRRTYQRWVDDGLFVQHKTGDKKNSPAYVKRSEIEKLIEEGKI